MLMKPNQLEKLIEKCLQDFYARRLKKIDELQLKRVLARKNPYLYKALATEKASDIVEKILADYVSSSDETIFGDAFFEPIAKAVSGGKVSEGAGVDFSVETKNKFMAVALKSGPNIYNSSQKKRQSDEFNSLRSRLLKLHKQFDPILGHAYGRLNKKPQKDLAYRDLSGQAFWKEITGDSDFYLKLIRLMKEKPMEYKKKYQISWDSAVNRFTLEFAKDLCFRDGRINWEKFTQYVSGE
jgi:hypothetical protein